MSCSFFSLTLDDTSSSSKPRNSASVSRTDCDARRYQWAPWCTPQMHPERRQGLLTPSPHPRVYGTNLNITSLRNKEAFSGPDTRAASAACCHSCPPHGGWDAAPHTMIHFHSSTHHPRRKGMGLLSPVLLPTLHPAPPPAPRPCPQHNSKYW